jgi:hypothetical protein
LVGCGDPGIEGCTLSQLNPLTILRLQVTDFAGANFVLIRV